jgi:hypothetical protein
MNRDIETQDVSIDLHVEMYPGTEVMTDYVGSHLTHSHNEKKTTVLVPQPCHLADDPLVTFLSAFVIFWTPLTFA